MNNISKIVIAEDVGKKLGYVLDVAIDFENMKKIGYFVVDEESENEFFLASADILRVSDEFVSIASASRLQFSVERNSVFAKTVLDENGNNLGVVLSVCFVGNYCQKLITDKCEISSKFVENVGQDFIFLRFKRKKSKKITQIFPKIEKSDVVVSIQDAKRLSRPVEIEKVVLSSEFYVGKVSTQDIFGYNNEKIAGKGQIITQSTVAKARQHNKLNQLFFAIKREK